MPKFPSKEEREKADKGNVVEFAQKMGVELNQVGSNSYKGVKHDSLVITPSENAWFWNSRQVGGFGARSFAQKYILADSNLDEAEKINKAVEMVNQANVSEGGNTVKRTDYSYNIHQESNKFGKAFSYLNKVRKIDPKTIKALYQANLVRQDRNGNVLFLWRDPENNKKVVGCSIQGTTIDHTRFGKRGTLKKIEKNSTPHMGWSFDVGSHGKTPENLVFCESCIDAMSYYDSARKTNMSLKNTRIVSMEGLKKGTVLNYIDSQSKSLAKEGKKLNSVKLAVDRDEAGTKFIETMQKEQNQAKQQENTFNQKINELNKSEKNSFAASFENLQHKFTNSEQINLATAPTFEPARVPKSLNGKDWNDFLKKLSSGNLHIIHTQKLKTRGNNLTVEKQAKPIQNKKESLLRQYQQALSQGMNR